MVLSLKQNIPLAPYTIYKIGGPARFFVEVRTVEELKEALVFAEEKRVPFFILGAGSNILVSENGFPGVVIRLKNGSIKIDGERMFVDAGVMMARAVLASAKAGLTGFEWGVGVPGTIGGSVRGNAGCFGGEMKDVVESVEVFDTKVGQVYLLPAGDCEFGYRNSIFKKHPEWVIWSVVLKLKEGDLVKIQSEVKRIVAERGQKQDIGTKTCGCIFKNTPWDKIAGCKEDLITKFSELREFQNNPNIPSSFLLDKTGLKGKRVGKVFISSKHANFFVNEGGTSSEEVRQLIELAKTEVEKKYGIKLEEEIQYLGFS